MCVSSTLREDNFYKINKVTIVVAIESWIMHIIFVIKHLFYHSSYLRYKKVCLFFAWLLIHTYDILLSR